MAARLTAMNGRSGAATGIGRRARWIMRANSSLPVPLSPRMSTVAESGPTLFTTSITSCIARLGPTTNSRSPMSCTSSRRVMSRRFRSCRSDACATVGAQACQGRYLSEKVIGAKLDRLHRAVEIGAVGHQDALGQRIVGAHNLQQLQPGHTGQLNIRDQQIDFFALHQREGGLARCRSQNLVVPLEWGRQPLPRVSQRRRRPSRLSSRTLIRRGV